MSAQASSSVTQRGIRKEATVPNPSSPPPELLFEESHELDVRVDSITETTWCLDSGRIFARLTLPAGAGPQAFRDSGNGESTLGTLAITQASAAPEMVDLRVPQPDLGVCAVLTAHCINLSEEGA
jgi:hypothetical protein